MFSTQPQPTYSYYNFAPAANHGQYSEGDEARWNLDDPRFTPGDHLWRTDEPVTYPNAHFDAKYRVQDYDSDPRSSFPQYTSHASQPRDGFDQQLPPFDTSFDPSTAFSQFHGSIGQEFSPFEPQSFSEHPASSFEAIPQNAPSYPARPLPPSVDSLSIPNEPDSRLLYGGQHDPTLSARYQPSFENLPVAASQQACSSLARPSSLNSLRFESDRSQSSPPRGRQSPSPSSRLHATPRRLNSNLSISIERAESSSRLSCHSRNSSSPHSASPFRSLPSPLSPVRKRPHSSHYESAQYDAANSSLAAYSSGTDSSNPQYLGELDSGVRESAGAAGDPGRAVGFEYASTGSEFVESYGLEQGVGELQIISRPSSSANGYPTAYHTFNPPPSSFDPLPLPPPAIKSGLEDTRRVREGQIRDFLRATDKLQAGERTVLILNPRIAQRSYGTERRLLNPPPMAYLLGTAWHPSSTDSLPGHHLPSPPPSRRILATPDVHVSIFPPRSAEKEALSSKESNPTATWMAPDGKTLLEHDEHAPVPICGRFVSKSLAVSLEGDLNKDTVSDVRTVVTVVDRDSQQLVGTFLGKPITVISKPSKKKSIMAGGTAGLVHGGLVALFNRTKAGSGSTRYLCTSGPQANFPTTDWKSMTSNAPRPFAPNDTADVRFISKTHSWDAFVIYAVDLTIPTHGEGLIQLPAPHQGYPKPPLNVVPVDARKSQALYYNQPVVLQCLATGVVSPVLIVRRIDSKTTVIGGGSLEPPPPNLVEISHLSVAPGERIGEPVSQYKNVAFEVFQAAATSLPRENPFDRRLPPSSFLGCVGEEIGIHVAEEEKTILKREVPLGPPTPAKLPSPPSYARNPLYASTNCFTPGAGVTATTTTTGFDSISEASSDDSDSTRKRARTSTTMGFAPQVALPPSPVSVGRPAAASRHKRRGQSLSSLAALQKSRSPSPPQTTGDLVWTVSCGESGVWSILAIDLARHSFFVPQSVDSMPTASMYSSSSLEKNPVPSTPVGPIIPIATRCEVSRRERIAEHEGTYAVLHGEHFDASYTIWVGDQPCAEQTVQSSRTVLFRPSMPAAMFNHPVPPPRRISIVRFDGVVFPTNVYYRD